MARSKPSAKSLLDRIDRARREGDSDKAVDLARQLDRQQPCEANRTLLREVLMQHGLEQQLMGRFKNAADDYHAAAALGGDAAVRTALAERLAGCGKLAEAQALVKDLPDDAKRSARLLGHAADYAVQHAHSGTSALPAELHTPLALIQQAWVHSEAGRDEEARTALQGIGLHSPFLEWKVLLRGLLALYDGEEARALENWQRLDPQRLPARLTAPLKYRLDPEYRKTLSPVLQMLIQERSVRLFSSPLIGRLQELRAALGRDNLAPAFRQAEKLLPDLKRAFPDLAARLANCFLWAIIAQGETEDLDRYQRVFGAPADDPKMQRAEALALETCGMMSEAHKAWQGFLKEVVRSKAWLPEAGQRAQALIWARMGGNALPSTRRRGPQRGSIFELFFESRQPLSLKPTAEECFRKSIALAPDRLEPYLALFQLLRQAKQPAKARKVGQELLKRFPDHAATMEALGDLAVEERDVKTACDHYAKAMQANPLERGLRAKLARARQNLALEQTREQKFDAARAEYHQALALWEGSKAPLLCSWALLERKAGDPERERELLDQARAEPDRRLAVPYLVLCEAVRAKLPPAQRKALAEAFEAEQARLPPTPPEVLRLLEAAAAQRADRLEAFTGQKTREKALLKFLDEIPLKTFDEAQTVRLCESLLALQARKPLETALRAAQKRFPHTPTFPLLCVDFFLTGRSPDRVIFPMNQRLEEARRLAEALPRGEQQQQILEEIREKQQRVRELDEELFGGFNPADDIFEFGDFDDEDYEDE